MRAPSRRPAGLLGAQKKKPLWGGFFIGGSGPDGLQAAGGVTVAVVLAVVAEPLMSLLQAVFMPVASPLAIASSRALKSGF